MRITFLGTGVMGAPMARRLAQAGHEVTAWNRSPDKARALAGDGVQVAADPAAAAVGAEAIVTMLTDGVVVEDVMAEAAPAAPQGTPWWQVSTVGISGTEGLVALAEEHHLDYVDAPVLGTEGAAQDGALVVLASGEPATLARLAPLFEVVGSKTMMLGEAGAGTRLKVVLSHWELTLTEAVAETIALAESIDLDPALYLEAIAGGPLDVGYAHDGDRPVAETALKDADLVLEAAERHDLDLDLVPVVRDRLARATSAP